jgi:beta-glucanase (GH16 family)
MKFNLFVIFFSLIFIGGIIFTFNAPKEISQAAPQDVVKEITEVEERQTTQIQEPVITDAHTENGWDMIWNEEFNAPVLNKTKWNALRDGNGWSERKQYYLPENVEVKEGFLTLNVLEKTKNEFKYTSGAVTTKGKFEFKYGKIEVRAKLPKGAGLIPAIWMLPASGAEYPEIDFAEIIGQNPDELWNVVHDLNSKGEYVREYNMTKLPDVTTDFHTYGIEWNENQITYFFDQKAIFTGTELIPERAMYLYMNVGVGGTWVGEPTSETVFPNEMLVDYVRFYKEEKGGN